MPNAIHKAKPIDPANMCGQDTLRAGLFDLSKTLKLDPNAPMRPLRSHRNHKISYITTYADLMIQAAIPSIVAKTFQDWFLNWNGMAVSLRALVNDEVIRWHDT